MAVSAYPLQWPLGWKRTDRYARATAKFTKCKNKLSVFDGVSRVIDELQRIDVRRDDLVISTNVETRLDGFPRSDRSEPGDPGAAVYWRTGKANRVMAIDIYDRVADNLAAIAATLDALRAIERHGGAAVLERAFTGFTALPAPDAERKWWAVLGVDRNCSLEDVKAAYRRLASINHPDRPGGLHASMAALNAARDQALQERLS